MSDGQAKREQLFALERLLDSVTYHNTDCEAYNKLYLVGEACTCGASDRVSGGNLYATLMQHIRALRLSSQTK